MTIRTAMLTIDENLPMQGFGLSNVGDIAFGTGKKLIFGDGSQQATAAVKATTVSLGLVQPDGTSILIDANGVISAVGTPLPTASPTVLGGVKIDGTTIVIDANGVISATGGGGGGYTLPTASTTILGGVKVDGTSVTIDGNGVISAAYALPTADVNTLGGVKIGGPTGMTMINGFASVNVSPTLSGLQIDLGTGQLRVKLGANMSLDGNGALTSTAAGGGGVSSLNGATGAVTLTVNGKGTNTNTIVLTSADITESGNLYFTNARAVAALAGQSISPTTLNVGSIYQASGVTGGQISVQADLVFGNGGSSGDLLLLSPNSHLTMAGGTISGAGSLSVTGAGSFGSLTIGGVAAATQSYVTSNFFPLTGGTLSGGLNMGGNSISNCGSLTTTGAVTINGGASLIVASGLFKTTNANAIFTNTANGSYISLEGWTFLAHRNGAEFGDYAEFVPNPADDLEPGDVAVIDLDHDEAVKKHTGTQYDRMVAGVHSTHPAMAISYDDGPQGGTAPVQSPQAVAGRVPTKVTTTYIDNQGQTVRRSIHRGDLVVASSIPGHAMAADPSDCPNGTIPPGSIIGKAMQDWDPAEGDAQEGQIKVWVNLG
jgi:hypothetical protein